jgi:hypothetical protein
MRVILYIDPVEHSPQIISQDGENTTGSEDPINKDKEILPT